VTVMAHAEGRRVDAARTRGRLAVRLTRLRVAAVLAVALLSLPVLAVGLDVLRQVVRPHEPLVADGARESLFAGVRSKVSLQLVGPGEAFSAEEPVADEGPLPGVPPQVSLQVRRLAVHLAAAGDVTAVDVSFPEVSSGRSQSFGFLAVRAVAGCSAGVSTRRPLGRR